MFNCFPLVTPTLEKTIVLNMIRMTSDDYFTAEKARPLTAQSDVHYVWAPDNSHAKTNRRLGHTDTDHNLNDDEDFEFSFGQDRQTDSNKLGDYNY